MKKAKDFERLNQKKGGSGSRSKKGGSGSDRK